MIERIKVVKVSHARQRPFLTMSGGAIKRKEYPIYAVVLQHPYFGNILIDTGYGKDFLNRLARVPRKVYGSLLLSEGCTFSDEKSIYRDFYDQVFLSHFHPDHIGGLDEVTYKDIKYSRKLKKLQQRSRFFQLRKGFFSELLSDIERKGVYFEEEKIISIDEYGFGERVGYDLLGDRSIVAIPMEGHAIGQYIFYIQTLKGPILYGVDVAWHIESIQDQRYPHVLTKFIVNDYKLMLQDIRELHQWHKSYLDVPILLSHCEKSLTQLLRWDRKEGAEQIVTQEN